VSDKFQMSVGIFGWTNNGYTDGYAGYIDFGYQTLDYGWQWVGEGLILPKV
jgi:hypothetical protein